MELRVLRYFLTVAQEGSITRAAERLHITQPTLSRQLMDLEEELHQALFDRRHHSLTLTPEGVLLRQRATEILGLVSKTESEFSSIGKQLSGSIHIGAGETDTMDDVAAVMAEIRKTHPAVHFHLYDDSLPHVCEMLDRGLLDFGVVIHPVDTSRYESLPLPKGNEWGLILRKDDPLARKDALSYEDIAKLPLFCSRPETAPGKGRRRDFPGWLAEKMPSLNIVGTMNLIYNATFLAERGVAYLLAVRMRNFIANNDTLCFRPFTPCIISEHSMIWKKGQVFSPAARHFLQKMRQAALTGS